MLGIRHLARRPGNTSKLRYVNWSISLPDKAEWWPIPCSPFLAGHWVICGYRSQRLRQFAVRPITRRFDCSQPDSGTIRAEENALGAGSSRLYRLGQVVYVSKSPQKRG
jgi:hypothetical protein